MIPRHSLPIGINKLFSIFLKPVHAGAPADIERAYSDALGVRETVLLPSVRAGIDMLIRVFDGKGITAVGPAYTCSTVHEAIVRSGARMRLVDSAADSFLMPPEEISAACESGCALILSEVYGIPYDLQILKIAIKTEPTLRILDMAMGIPSGQRMQQLEVRDVALFSFGWGKPMYAGWGGIACLQDPAVAERVREIRDRLVAPESAAVRFHHACAASFLTIMNHRTLYGLSHGKYIYRLIRQTLSRDDRVCRPDKPGDMLPRQWTRPMTTLNRKIALHNLRYSVQNANIRREQAEAYQMILVEPGIVTGPGGNAFPQSHFPIRVPFAIRDKMCDYLRSRGIDTSTAFPLSKEMSRDSYQWARRASGEVIALPLGPTITLEEVRMISRCVKDGLSALGGKDTPEKDELRH